MTAGLAKGQMDGTRVQLDYILSDARACVESVWHDQLIPIGIGPSLCALRSSLGWCETTFTEQTIEFEKLDANSGC